MKRLFKHLFFVIILTNLALSSSAQGFYARVINEDAILQICSIAGQKLISMEFKAGKDISVEWLKEGLFPKPGCMWRNCGLGDSMAQS